MDSVENYTDLFTIVLRNDDIEEFDSKWDGILLFMTKIPPDEILEGLYKLRIRESEKLKTVLELYDLETHQKKLGPDFHRFKTMVKRGTSRKFEIRILGAEMEILRRTPWSRIRGHNSVYKEFLEIVGNGKPTGQCVKGDNCSFRHDMNKRGKVAPSNPSPNSIMQQNERKASRTPKSQR